MSGIEWQPLPSPNWPIRLAVAVGLAERRGPPSATNPNGPIFRIEGRSIPDDVAIDGAAVEPADSVIRNAATDEVWIRLDQSWRTPWR